MKNGNKLLVLILFPILLIGCGKAGALNFESIKAGAVPTASTIMATKEPETNQEKVTETTKIKETKEPSKVSQKSELEGTWPKSELLADVPKPRAGSVKTSKSTKEDCVIYVTMTYSQCLSYTQDIIDSGYLYNEEKLTTFKEQKTGSTQFGKEDGRGIIVTYTSGLVKILVFR